MWWRIHSKEASQTRDYCAAKARRFARLAWVLRGTKRVPLRMTLISEPRAGRMRLGKFMTGWLATALLCVAAVAASSSPCQAQRSNNFHPVQGRQAAPNHQQPHPGQRHAGDWLRRYKGLPPSEQDRALQNDPGFRGMSPQQQQRLRQQLHYFASLPPQQQQRIVDNMDRWAHLTPEQKQQARTVFSQMRQLPPDRRRMVTTAVRDLSDMPPEERERIINSGRFKKMFSPEERDIMLGAVRLPLAPQEGARPEGPPQQ